MSNIRVEETVFEEVKPEVFQTSSFAFDFVEAFLVLSIVVSSFRFIRQYLYNKKNDKIK